MAKIRWATFSVADHRDITRIVPDVLLFDRLSFPCPAEEERDTWDKKGWDSQRLYECLSTLSEIAHPIRWDEEKQDDYRTQLDQAQRLQRRLARHAALIRAHGESQLAYQATREVLASHLRGTHGDQYWIMPRFGSCETFLQDQNAKIAPADRKSRREALALLVGQRMKVPDNADPKVALRLAADLVRDNDYLRSRRALFDWQEDVIQREQSGDDDARQLDDLIADLNKLIAKTGKTREQWLFFVMKKAVGAAEIVHKPLAAAHAAIDLVEFLRGGGVEIPPGPMAAFQHVRQQVLAPSVVSKWWRPGA